MLGPLRLLILQATPFCNLACTYCYLPDKSLKKKMSEQVIVNAAKMIQDHNLINNELSVVWHAGEPLAAGIEFYRKAHALLQKQLGSNVKIKHCIQSNGTLISKKWCDLFQEIGVNLGLSIDGPAEVHDRYRLNKAGGPSLKSVLQGIDVLYQNNIRFHTISVVTKDSIDKAEEIFRFLHSLNPTSIAFNVEEIEGTHDHSTMTGINQEDYHKFLRRMHELSFEIGDPNYIREFRQVHTSIMGTLRQDRMILSMENHPLSIINVDIYGNFSTFSPELLGMKHKQYGDFILGNVLKDRLDEVIEREKFTNMLEHIRKGVQMCRDSCDYFYFCGGGSPSNKLFENGSFASSETMHCRLSKKLIVDLAIDRVQTIVGEVI